MPDDGIKNQINLYTVDATLHSCAIHKFNCPHYCQVCNRPVCFFCIEDNPNNPSFPNCYRDHSISYLFEIMNEKIKQVVNKKAESTNEKNKKERDKKTCLEENKKLDECRIKLLKLRDLHTEEAKAIAKKLDEMKTASENLAIKENQNLQRIEQIIVDFDLKIGNYGAMLEATTLAYKAYTNAFQALNGFANNALAQDSYDEQMGNLGSALKRFNEAVVNNHNAFKSIKEFLKSATVVDAMKQVAATEETIKRCTEFYEYCFEKGADFLGGTVNPPMPGASQPLVQQPQAKVSLPKEQSKIDDLGNHKVIEFGIGSLMYTMAFDLNVKYNSVKAEKTYPDVTGVLEVRGIKFEHKFRYMPSYCVSQDEKFLYIFGGYSKVIIKLNLASDEIQEAVVADMLTKGTGIVCNGKLIIVGSINYIQDPQKLIEESKTSIHIYSADDLSFISKGVIENMKYIMSPGLIRLKEKDKILICGGETPVGDYDKVYKLNLNNSTVVKEKSLELPASFYPTKPYYFGDNKSCVLIDSMNRAHIYNMNDGSWLMISAGNKNIEPYIKKLIL
jgi:tetratricopeptide (TPR) repeat protein